MGALTACAVLLGACVLPCCGAAEESALRAEPTAGGDAGSYAAYVADHTPSDRAEDRITLTTEQLGRSEKSRLLPDYLGYGQEVVLSEEGGCVEYRFEVKTAGFYTVTADFCVPAGHRTAAERTVLVNGELPFAEAASLVFKRRFVNGTEIRRDVGGNDIRPVQTEEEGWQSRSLTDAVGYYDTPLTFYLEQGVNTLCFEAVREPLILGRLVLAAPEALPSYRELEERYRAEGLTDGDGASLRLQGEAADVKSDQTLAPVSDRSSPATEPSSPSKIRLNSIGGESF